MGETIAKHQLDLVLPLLTETSNHDPAEALGKEKETLVDADRDQDLLSADLTKTTALHASEITINTLRELS